MRDNEKGLAPFFIIIIIIGSLVIGGELWNKAHEEKPQEDLTVIESTCEPGEHQDHDAYNRPIGSCEEITNFSVAQTSSGPTGSR